MSAAVELVKPLKHHRPGQIVALYRRGDRFFYVSTVLDVGGSDLSPGNQALVELGSIAGALLGRDCATSGEETMAFEADDDGNVSDWGEVAVATGPDSRESVLQQLARIEDDR